MFKDSVDSEDDLGIKVGPLRYKKTPGPRYSAVKPDFPGFKLLFSFPPSPLTPFLEDSVETIPWPSFPAG